MSIESMKEKMKSGEIYDPYDSELAVFQLERIEMVNEFNKTPSSPEGLKKRDELLNKMFVSFGADGYIEPPFHANMGGLNTKIGNRFYANFNLTLVDDGEITIGDNVLIGPNVTLATACHPICPTVREKGFQYNKKVTIGNNVWIGSGAMVMPGVTIGDNSVIGAGSVVTKDIPSGVVAVGNPCKVIRRISAEDYITFDHGKPIPEEFLK